MTSPLSPAQDAALNSSSSSLTKRKYDDYDIKPSSFAARSGSASPSQMSSPSERSKTNIKAHAHAHAHDGATHASDQENFSPSKNRHSRIMSGNELSPLRIVESQRSSLGDSSGAASSSSSSTSSRLGRSPRKMSPEKRFPVKVSVSGDDIQPPAPPPPPRMTHQRTTSLENAVMENEGLKRAIELFEDEQSILELDEAGDSLATIGAVGAGVGGDEAAVPDESIISTFSTFSAVPNMTMFAKLGHTPSKLTGLGISNMTPRRRDPSPLKSSHRPYTSSDTDMLLDFSEHRSGRSSASPTRRSNVSLSPSRSTPKLTQTPSHQSSISSSFGNLLDFDIPPMPTPRSVPSITPRELESLKSKFLSEISSLKASLSGKEAEVQSLKSAVKDAEKRVGQSLEKLREERTLKEQLAVEKEGWENRGREMESMLRKIKEEILTSHREREELEKQLEESEKRKEMSEMMYQEAETKLASLRTGKDLDKQQHSPGKARSPGPGSGREVEIAVERVARELHALYKSKHETKVAALKKSYENRWEKKVRALEAKLEEVNGENERLRAGPDPDATMARFDVEEAMELKDQAVRDNTTIKELHANSERLEAIVSSVKKDNEKLHKLLQQERVEKGELVQLAEELMGMQQNYVAGTPAPKGKGQVQAQAQAHAHALAQTPAPAQSQEDEVETAVKIPKIPLPGPRSSGIRAPGMSGLRAPTGMTKSSTAPVGGLPRPGPRSGGIMSSIEKMGNYRGRGE